MHGTKYLTIATPAPIDFMEVDKSYAFNFEDAISEISFRFQLH